jgi:hypothetical protein
MLGPIKRDLLVRGLDANNVEIGPNGTFVEKTKPLGNTSEEKQVQNALVQLSEVTTNIDTETSDIVEEKSIKAKRKPKSE